MSRREGTRSAPVCAGAPQVPGCASSAGESPVPVSAEAPGSRPQPSGEIPKVKAGHRKPIQSEPLRRERERGPQHEVNPAASTDKQWGIRDLNPVLRGWANYFRTGNAARKFVQVDDFVWWRLKRFLMKRNGRNFHAGRADAWTSDFFVETHGLHRLRGTIRYPEAA